MATFFGKEIRLPGAAQESEQPMSEDMAAMLMTRKADQKVIDGEDIKKAAEILTRYKAGKANLENRIVEDELWWELRHWEAIRGGRNGYSAVPGPDGRPGRRTDPNSPEPTSAWLFNAIMNKHADAMDNFPEPMALPRERSDEESAKTLSSVLPVILECNDFEQTYSDAWWEKLKHGTAAYGVFWDSGRENGLGDVNIRQIDLLNLFWEPGVTDIQKSRNLFIADLVDDDLLDRQYPELKGKTHGSVVDVKQYIYDDTVDTSGKSVVVDWYYKVKSPSGKTLVHYVKFVGDQLLYASENDPEYRDRGFYDHGLYPVVLDVLFPEKGTPVGFGYVSICKDPQLYIDKLSSNILENAMMATKRRYFASDSTNINEEEFLDWNKPLVHVQGELDDRRLKEIVSAPLDSIYVDVMQMKIEEMKDTAANRDVNSGGTGSSVTAAAAIAALQEAGNKASRDMISSSYRTHVKINSMCVELARQFYDVSRTFRIISPNTDGYAFVDFNNAGLKEQFMGTGADGQPMYRKPIFDIKIRAQKKNPFSRMEQNERAKELYNLGFFNPDRAQESLACLEMMDFEGIDKVREYVRQGQTLLNICQQLQQENQMLKIAVAGPQAVAGSAGSGGEAAPASASAPQEKPAESGLAGGIMKAQTPMTGYGERLAKRSAPSMDV
ncbi:hypothetical protein [uncultured Oscillibacter sp.]|uniref:portal protein n=1 Tax=uncultured Oscillibacter sp. TaxID=876091 RepID=UPI0025DA1E30|nr:hypothetical protein [uncultured Oscillibacter sp.]